MMGSNPLVSIITPTLNSASTIEDCLKSVACQSYNNIEHLIIDGVSSDATLDIVKKYESEYSHIRIISEKDRGIYDAMNKGIDIARGEWLLFLGSDDTLVKEDVLMSLLPILTDSKINIIYGNVVYKMSGKKYDGKFNKIKLLKKNICHQSILTRKEIFNKFGKFDIRYKVYADWHFNMKWFNDASIRHHYTELVIARFYENGYCCKALDEAFIQDLASNKTKYFSKNVRVLSQIKNFRLVRKLLKVIRIE
jgi:glycosyltransferase involved in cell wall biosynthesis